MSVPSVPSIFLTKPTVRVSSNPTLNLDKPLPAVPTEFSAIPIFRPQVMPMATSKAGSKEPDLNKSLPTIPRKPVLLSTSAQQPKANLVPKPEADFNKPLPPFPNVVERPVSKATTVHELDSVKNKIEPVPKRQYKAYSIPQPVLQPKPKYKAYSLPKPEPEPAVELDSTPLPEAVQELDSTSSPQPMPELDSTPLPRRSSSGSSYTPSLPSSCKDVYLSFWKANKKQTRDRLTWIFDGRPLVYKSPRYIFYTEELQASSRKNGGLTPEEASLISDIARVAGQRIYIPLIGGENIWVPEVRSERNFMAFARPSTPGSDFVFFDDAKAADIALDELFTFFDDSDSEVIETSPITSIESKATDPFSFEVGDSLDFGVDKPLNHVSASSPSDASLFSVSTSSTASFESGSTVVNSYHADDETEFQNKQPVSFSQHKRTSRALPPLAVNMEAVRSYDERHRVSEYSVAVRGQQVSRRPVGGQCVVL